MEKLKLYLPEKSILITDDDKPWITTRIKEIDSRKKREYNKK